MKLLEKILGFHKLPISNIYESNFQFIEGLIYETFSITCSIPLHLNGYSDCIQSLKEKHIIVQLVDYFILF